MGITRLGAATDWAGKAALRYWGLEPGRDVSFVQLGGNPEILLGLETGAVESGLLTDPVLRQARQRGYRQLLDLADTGVHFSPTGLVTTSTIIPDPAPRPRAAPHGPRPAAPRSRSSAASPAPGSTGSTTSPRTSRAVSRRWRN